MYVVYLAVMNCEIGERATIQCWITENCHRLLFCKINQSDNISAQYGVELRLGSINTVFGELGIQHIFKKSEFPYFSNAEVRLWSFKTLSNGIPLMQNSLCDVGFYHTGKGDKTVFFHFG